MTPEDQRVAIAEAWTKFFEPNDLGEGTGRWMWHKGNENRMEVPDYCNDLNAMRPVEIEYVKQHGDYMYLMILHDVVTRDTPGKGFSFLMATATAAQRAEAFLRTIGKWK